MTASAARSPIGRPDLSALRRRLDAYRRGQGRGRFLESAEAYAEVLNVVAAIAETEGRRPRGGRRSQDYALANPEQAAAVLRTLVVGGDLSLGDAETLRELLSEAFEKDLTDLERRRFEVLAQIALSVAQRDLVAAALDEAVKQARELDLPWTRIATSIGVTAQSVQRKWDPVSKRSHRDYQRSRYKAAGEADGEDTTD